MPKGDKNKIKQKITSRIVKKDGNDKVYEITERSYEKKEDGSVEFLGKEECIEEEEIQKKLEELNQSRRND